MFCNSCGKQVADTERFCPNCGAVLGGPQQAPHAQQAPQQRAYNQYGAPAPVDKKKIFSIFVPIVFGLCAVFALLALIGACTRGGSAPGMIISYVFVILACTAIALAPLFGNYKKFCILIAAVVLAIGMYGLSISGLSSSVGFLFTMLGYAGLAFVCWLYYNDNSLSKVVWFIPAALIFIGSLLNWIIIRYFTLMRWALMYYLFGFLFDLFMIAGAILLPLYLMELRNEKSVKFSVPDPAQRRPKAPNQPPYQGR